MQKITCYFLLFAFLVLSISYSSFAEETWKKTDRTIDNFCHKLAKNYNLKLLLTGYGNIVDSGQVQWDVSLLSHQEMKLEESRKLIVSLTHDYLTKVYNDPLLIKYIESSMEQTRWWIPPAIKPSRVGIKLSFWTKNFDRVPKPYIAQALLKNEKFEYFTTNPEDQSLILLHSESLQEAFDLLLRTLPEPLNGLPK